VVLTRQSDSEIMTVYLAAVGAADRVEREIAETDQEIDARVYALYGLDADSLMVARILLIAQDFYEVARWGTELSIWGGDAERRNRISPVRRSVAV